jgi:peptidoglycan/xylan/chitin deacetylase (PgdA/CDA1 family)
MQERAYGPKVGVPRFLRLLREFEIKATFYVPSFNIPRHLDTMLAIQGDGHELASHGHVHELITTLDQAREIQVLEQQLEIFQTHLNMIPAGYRAPGWELNKRTPGLLKKFGFKYDSSLMEDDIPYWLDTPEGPLMEVPVSWALDDAPLYRYALNWSNAIADPDRVIRMWNREFKGLYDEGGCFMLTIHPFLSGRPSRVEALREVIEYARGFDGVWFATAEDVARWATTLPSLGRSNAAVDV